MRTAASFGDPRRLRPRRRRTGCWARSSSSLNAWSRSRSVPMSWSARGPTPAAACELRMEDTGAVASWLGTGESLLPRILSRGGGASSALDAVSADDLLRVARRYVRPDLARLAVLGPFRSRRRFERLSIYRPERPRDRGGVSSSTCSPTTCRLHARSWRRACPAWPRGSCAATSRGSRPAGRTSLEQLDVARGRCWPRPSGARAGRLPLERRSTPSGPARSSGGGRS